MHAHDSQAAWAGQKDAVQLLIAAGAQLSAAATDDINALHFASQKGHQEVCRLLINSGLHVNGRSRKGQTPLHFAAYVSIRIHYLFSMVTYMHNSTSVVIFPHNVCT